MGILPPEALNPKREFGEKPMIWDVYAGVHGGEEGGFGYEGWEDLLPITARLDHAPPSSPGDINPSLSSPPHRERFTRRIFHRNRQPAETPSPPTMADPSFTVDAIRDQDLQVGIMLAMPSQRHRTHSIPEMVIGLAVVPVKGES